LTRAAASAIFDEGVDAHVGSVGAVDVSATFVDKGGAQVQGAVKGQVDDHGSKRDPFRYPVLRQREKTR
jgi:hypothetical protein